MVMVKVLSALMVLAVVGSEALASTIPPPIIIIGGAGPESFAKASGSLQDPVNGYLEYNYTVPQVIADGRSTERGAIASAANVPAGTVQASASSTDPSGFANGVPNFDFTTATARAEVHDRLTFSGAFSGDTSAVLNARVQGTLNPSLLLQPPGGPLGQTIDNVWAGFAFGAGTGGSDFTRFDRSFVVAGVCDSCVQGNSVDFLYQIPFSISSGLPVTVFADLSATSVWSSSASISSSIWLTLPEGVTFRGCQ
jgi:hypothetical protein